MREGQDRGRRSAYRATVPGQLHERRGMSTPPPGGTLALAPALSLSRMGYGAMQLAGAGVIRHLGLSGVGSAQLTEAQSNAPVVTVQNLYNLANRQGDELVDRCAREGIAFAPFFPLGGFTPVQSDVLDRVAARLEASAQQVALAWLLQRSPAIVLIP